MRQPVFWHLCCWRFAASVKASVLAENGAARSCWPRKTLLGKRSWCRMFPQLGAPVGLFLSSGVFWILLHFMSQEALLSWGWRIPFVASIILIAVGMWVRLSITETPAFQKAIEKEERVAVPVVELFRNHKRSLALSTFVALATFVLFYIGTAYLLSYNVKVLKIPFLDALEVQIMGSIVFGIFIPIAGKLAERFGRREILILTTVLIGLFSFLLPTLMTGGEGSIFIFAALAMTLMGMTYGLIGTALAAPSRQGCATPARPSPSTWQASSAHRWHPTSPHGCR